MMQLAVRNHVFSMPLPISHYKSKENLINIIYNLTVEETRYEVSDTNFVF